MLISALVHVNHVKTSQSLGQGLCHTSFSLYIFYILLFWSRIMLD